MRLEKFFGRCRKSLELHNKRHRDIASLAAEVLRDDDANQMMLDPSKTKNKKAIQSDSLLTFQSENLAVVASGEESTDGEHKDSLAEDDVLAAPLFTGLVENNLESRKVAKAKRKTAKGRKNVQVITSERLEMIDEVLHPQSYVSDDSINQTIQAINREGIVPASGNIPKNLALSTNCLKASVRNQIIRANKLAKENKGRKRHLPQDAQENPLVATLLEKLGIKASLPHATKKRNDMVGKLQRLIQKDLITVDNEDRETMTRMAGYWRYVNRKTYNYMVRHYLLWDWETGGQLEEVDAEDESGLDVDDDYSAAGIHSDPETDVDSANLKLEDATKDLESKEGTSQLIAADQDMGLDTEQITKKSTSPEADGELFSDSDPDTKLKEREMSGSVSTIGNVGSRMHHNEEEHSRIEASSLAARTGSDDNQPFSTNNRQPSSTSVTIMVPTRPYKDHNNFYSPLADQDTPRPVRSLRIVIPAAPKALVAEPASPGEVTVHKGRPSANKASQKKKKKPVMGRWR